MSIILVNTSTVVYTSTRAHCTSTLSTLPPGPPPRPGRARGGPRARECWEGKYMKFTLRSRFNCDLKAIAQALKIITIRISVLLAALPRAARFRDKENKKPLYFVSPQPLIIWGRLAIFHLRPLALPRARSRACAPLRAPAPPMAPP